MNQDKGVLRSEEEMLASLAPEDVASVTAMIAARKRFDDQVEPIIVAMLAEVQSDDGAPMSDDAMAVMNGIQQSLTGHLGKIVAVVGLGTPDEDGKSSINATVSQCVTALVETVHMTIGHLGDLKAARESDNG